MIKEFVVKINDSDKMEFLDKKDEATFESLLSLMKRQGIDRFRLTISKMYEKTTEKQKNLFKVLCSAVSHKTGYTISEVEENLVKSFDSERDNINQISKEEFSLFLEQSLSFCNQFFNMKISIGKDGMIKTY